MEQKEFFRILEKYQQGTASMEEKKIVDAWYRAMGENVNTPSNFNEEELANTYWESIESNISLQKHVESKKSGIDTAAFSRYSIGIAASLLVAAISFFYLTYGDKSVKIERLAQNQNKEQELVPGNWEQIRNPDNTDQKHTLSDGSTITLKPQSAIKFASDFNTTTREIYLEGEAFFEVAHNKERPFLVYANGIITKVLGTSFTIKAFKHEKNVVVSVSTGKVSVYNGQRDTPDQKAEVILTPNQQIIYDKRKETIARGIVEAPQLLLQPEEIKRMRFEAAPIKEIFEAIEKAYGIEIEFDEALSSCKLTTSISDGDLYRRLGIVTRAIGAEYTLNEDKIVVTGAGCH